MSAITRHSAVSRGAAVLLAGLMGLAAIGQAEAASVASIQRNFDEATGQAPTYRADRTVSSAGSVAPVVDEGACTHTFLAHRYRGC